MKDFFKMFFASCLGAMIGIVCLFLIIMMIGSAMSMGDSELKTDGILVLDFKEQFIEKTDNIESDPFSGGIENIGLRDFDRYMDKIKNDDQIKGILIKSPEISVGQSTLSSIMESLGKVKEEGKFIYAYSDIYTQSNYFLSTVADSIFLNPNGIVDARGYSTMIPFFKEGMDKLGVKMDIFYAGDFKSATEPFRRTSMSPENKLQTRVFLNEMYDIMKEKVAENRGTSADQVDQFLSEFSGRTAETALEANMVDGLKYWNEVEAMLKDKVGKDQDKKLKYTSFSEYTSKSKLKSKGKSKSKVAVVYAEGNVGYGSHSKGSITDQEYMKIFSKIRRDDKIKSIVLRVNSGGGSALTSDIIWEEIEQCKAQGIPVIASFGDYAASGGYYIAAGADTIVAASNTLTGSIGVFSMLPNVRSLMVDKLGVAFDTVKTHDLAVGYTGVYELSDREKVYFEESTDAIYEKFLTRVADGRGMTKEEVHKIAQGRVWTGLKGKEIGLVDVIGGLDDAIEIASAKAGLDGDYKIAEYPYIKKDPFEEFIKEFSKGLSGEDDAMVKLSSSNKKLLELYKANQFWLEVEGPQARMPYIFDFR